MQIKWIVAGASLLLVSAAAHADRLVIYNQSSSQIDHLYVSAVDMNKWGADQLGDQVIAPGGKFTLKNIDPDSYDLRLETDANDVCEVHGVDFSDTPEVSIDNDELDDCN
jgi:hypothetical protein